jgi:hypothetical protein
VAHNSFVSFVFLDIVEIVFYSAGVPVEREPLMYKLCDGFSTVCGERLYEPINVGNGVGFPLVFGLEVEVKVSRV